MHLPRHLPDEDRRASGKRRSSLDEPVDDGARQQGEDGDRRMQVRPAGALESEAVHLTEPRHGLAGPTVEVSLPVGDPEQIPDDLFEMIGVWDGQDQHAAALQHPVKLRERPERVRDMLEHFDAKHEVIGAVREWDPLRDVSDEHVGAGELGCDVYTLVHDAGREKPLEPPVAGADVQHRSAGEDARERRRLAEPHAFLAFGAPGGAGAVKVPQLGRSGLDFERHCSDGGPGRCRSWSTSRCSARTSSRIPATISPTKPKPNRAIPEITRIMMRSRSGRKPTCAGPNRNHSAPRPTTEPRRNSTAPATPKKSIGLRPKRS